VQVGPLIDEAGRSKVQRLVDDAVARGAKVEVGGAPLPGPGYFYPPTVLTGVATDAEMHHNEIFGPVAPVTTFETEDEVVTAANATPFGLVSYVYTRDLDRALRLSEALETGMLGINQGIVSTPAAPSRGVARSRLGRQGGPVVVAYSPHFRFVSVD